MFQKLEALGVRRVHARAIVAWVVALLP
jgi:hypothetical protein